jgi:hypothetical protein
MPSPRVPIIETVLGAWVDAFRAIRAMPVVARWAQVILSATGIAAWWVSVTLLLGGGRTVDEWLASPSWFVITLINTSLQIVLLAPLAIAVQRFVIRGDVARGYPLNPLRPSYLTYVGTALAINLAFRLPDLIRMLAANVDGMPAAGEIAIWYVTLAFMISVPIVVLRRIAIFSAIAINAPNARWRNAVPVDAGNTFRIILIALAIWLPGAIYGVLVHAYVPMPRSPNEIGGALLLPLAIWLPQLVIISAFAAACARVYTALAEPKAAPAERAPGAAVA